LKSKNWQAQPIGSANRFSLRLAALVFTLILVPTTLPPLLRAYFGRKAVWDFYLFELVVFGVILAVGLPLAIHRAKSLQSLVGSGWIYRGLLVLVAVVFAYPVIRILMIAPKVAVIIG
jgi:hypothetical protein